MAETETGWTDRYPQKSGAGDEYYFVRRKDRADVVVMGFSMGKAWLNGVSYDPSELRSHLFLGPISPSDFEQLARLRDWKESAMTLLARYDGIAETFSGKLGSSKIDNLERGVEQLWAATEKALTALESERVRLCGYCKQGHAFDVKQNAHVWRKLGDKFDGATLGCDAAHLHGVITALRNALRPQSAALAHRQTAGEKS